MLLRPEIAGMIGLVAGAAGGLAIWLRHLPPPTTGHACPRCGTMQPLPSRPSVLARQVFGRNNCVGCGRTLEHPRTST